MPKALRLLAITLLAAALLTACGGRQPDGRQPGDQTATLQGTIAVPDDFPFGAVLYLTPFDGTNPIANASAVEPDRTYVFKDVPPGEYSLLLYTTLGHGAYHPDIVLHAGKTITIDLTLEANGTIEGTATLEGPPTQSGRIAINLLGTPLDSITNDAGGFVPLHAPPGTYTLTASKPGYETGIVREVTVKSHETTLLPTITLTPDPEGG